MRTTKTQLEERNNALNRENTALREVLRCFVLGIDPDAMSGAEYPEGNKLELRLYGVKRSHAGVLLVTDSASFSVFIFDDYHHDVRQWRSLETLDLRNAVDRLWALRSEFFREERSA